MHEVESLAYAGELPWHGLGIKIGEEGSRITGKEMLVTAGLDWETYKDPVKAASDDMLLPDWYTVRRRGPNLRINNALGCVQKQFTCIQNEEIFGIPDELVNEGRVVYEVAGALRDGAIVFALARMSDFEIARLGGLSDHIDRFLLWTAGHGNGRAVIGGYTDVRVVCKNTLDMAMGDSHGTAIKNRFRIKHTKSGPERVAEAHKILLQLEENGQRQQQMYQELALTPMDIRQAGAFYEEWLNEELGVLDKEAEDFEKRHAKREEVIQQLERNFCESPGNTGESAWDGYNGLGYFLDHQRARVRNAVTRMDSIVLGGQVYNQKGRAAKKLLAWTRDGRLRRVRG